ERTPRGLPILWPTVSLREHQIPLARRALKFPFLQGQTKLGRNTELPKGVLCLRGREHRLLVAIVPGPVSPDRHFVLFKIYVAPHQRQCFAMANPRQWECGQNGLSKSWLGRLDQF